MTMRLLSVAAAAISILASAPASAAQLKVCTTDFPPYTINQGGTVAGIHTDMVVAAFKALGHEVAIENVAWERCMKNVETGTTDALYSASFKPERAQFGIYPKEALQTLSYVALVAKGASHGWSDAKEAAKLPQPVGSPRGYSVTDDLKKVAGVTVDDGGTTDSQNMQKLMAGRVKTAMMETSIAQYLIKQLNAADKVEVLAPPFVAGKDYFIVVSKKHGGSEQAAQALADNLDKALAGLKKDGILERVSAKY